MRKIKKAFKKHVAANRGVNTKEINIKSIRKFKSPSTHTTRYMVRFILNDNIESIGAYPPLPNNLTI